MGIYQFGARFYSPKLGRFLSADSIVPGYANPQNLNRFSYVRNNPIRFTDPSGHICVSAGEGDCRTTTSTGRSIPVSGSGSFANTGVRRSPGGGGGRDLGLEFRGDWQSDDMQAFVDATQQEANRQYRAFCSNNPHFAGDCGYSSSEELYVATHGTTVLTFSNSSVDGYFCERNANAGQQGVSCYANSRGDITPIIAAHEMGHVFNALIANNGQPIPYNDLATERANNDAFPDIREDITPGHLSSRRLLEGEDFANMYSMWVFNEWPDTPGGEERRHFMDNNMFTWILRQLP